MVSLPQEPEVALAQRLAANERPVRTRALKTLRKYINLRSRAAAGGFCRDDLLKIWKGLFYSLWMQDKPDLQKELSDRVSGLIHSFHTFDNQLLYFEAFVQTVKREWNGIDRLRMDKFFQLVRFVFRQVFEVLRRREWESSVVDQFLAVFTAELLESASRVPDGLMLHVLDLYMTELAAVGSEELTAEQNLTFIQPFCKTISKTKDRTVLKCICNKIFSTILDHASYAVEELMKELSDGEEDLDSAEGEDEEEDEEEEKTGRRKLKKAKKMKVNGLSDMENGDEESFYELMEMDEKDTDDDDVGPVLQFDYGAIADRLFELGSRPKTPNFNRAKIYKFVKIFRDLSEGIFPQKEDDEQPKNSASKKNKKKRFQTDDDDDEQPKRSTLKKNKKKGVQTDDKPPAKKRKACDNEQTELTDPGQDGEPSSENIKKKKNNNKGAETEQSEDRLETAVEAEAVEVDTETQSQSQEDEGLRGGLEASGKKKKKGRKLRTGSTVQDTEAECDSDLQLTNTEEELRRCLAAEMLEEMTSASLQTTAPPSGKKKRGKKSEKIQGEEPSSDCRDQTVTDIQLENGLSASSSVKKTKKNKKRKQKSAKEDEETSEASVPSLSESSFTGADSKDDDRVVEDNKPIIAASDDAVVTDAGMPHAKAVTPKKNKKNKKQKVKESAAQSDDPTEAEDKEGGAHAADDVEEAPCEAEAAGIVQTPTRRKRGQKKQKKQILQQSEDVNEEIQISECSEEPVLKKSRKQKKNAEEAEAADKESTPLRKTKKKRKLQREEAETSQTNGQAVKEDPEISISAKSKKKLKKASSQSEFASFPTRSAAPTPLFCRAKPKGKSGKSAAILKTLMKADAKKVTFGLKNNKTTEFRKTDQSLLVSPVGSSRVAFDPEKKPASGVLKSPSASPFTSLKKSTPKKRPTAADFF